MSPYQTCSGRARRGALGRVDLARAIRAKFGIVLAERRIGSVLRRPDFGRLVLMPRHRGQDAAAKTSMAGTGLQCGQLTKWKGKNCGKCGFVTPKARKHCSGWSESGEVTPNHCFCMIFFAATAVLPFPLSGALLRPLIHLYGHNDAWLH